MRFSFFGQGEGMHSDCDQRLWASVRDGIVTDASVSARKRGVGPGMTAASAEALVPGITLCGKDVLATCAITRVWNTIWSYTPWLETVNEDSCWFQIPGDDPPLREARELLLNISQQLGEERRLRVGMAENPFLARALVAWSRLERVPNALYRKVGAEEWLISPGLAENRASPRRRVSGSVEAKKWFLRMPIRALWVLDPAVRDALIRLGIERLQDLVSVPSAQLQRHFGKESLLWARFLEQPAGGRLRVNYPPMDRREMWAATVDEPAAVDALQSIVQMLIQPISADLEKNGTGALKVGLRWGTDSHQGEYERTARRPLVSSDSLFAQLAPGFADCKGRSLELVEVFVEDLRPLSAIQTSFIVHEGMLLPTQSIERDELRKVIHQVNRKYPHVLNLGIRPRFRELRLSVAESPLPQPGYLPRGRSKDR